MSFEADHAYLRATVAAPLTEALAQLAVLQPEDPVEFLGAFLLKHVDTELQKQDRAKLKHASPPPTAGSYRDGDDEGRVESDRMLALERSLQERLPAAATMNELCDVFLSWLASALNAEEAYLGRKIADPATGGSLIHWIASSRGRESVTVDKFLTETSDTITFDVFKEAPVSPEDDPVLDADGNPLPPAVPKFIHVENVLREPRIKFFHVPKLGAYLTRGLQFKSFLHADVVNEANVEEPTIKDEWLVVSADTMGQARAFTATEIDAFQRASSFFAQTLETLERKLYMADVERMTTNGEEAQLKEFSVAFAAQIAVQEENLMLQVQSLPEEEKTLKEAQLREAFMTYLLQSHAPTIALAAEHVVPFKLSVLAVFASALVLLGHNKGDLLNVATKLPSWDKIAPLLCENQLIPRLERFTLPPREAVALAKQLLGEISKSDADTASPIAGCLFAWTQAVFTHGDQVETAAERTRAAAEEAAAAAEE